jgi:hypothetical protein
VDFPRFHGNSIFWRSVAQNGPNRSLGRGGLYLSLAQFSSSEDLYLRTYGRLKLSEKIEKNLKSSLKQISLRSLRNRYLRKNSWCFKKKFMSNGLFFRILMAVNMKKTARYTTFKKSCSSTNTHVTQLKLRTDKPTNTPVVQQTHM